MKYRTLFPRSMQKSSHYKLDRDTQLRQVFLPDTTGRGPACLFATNIIPALLTHFFFMLGWIYRFQVSAVLLELNDHQRSGEIGTE